MSNDSVKVIADSTAKDKFNLPESVTSPQEADKLIDKINASKQGDAKKNESGEVVVRTLLQD